MRNPSKRKEKRGLRELAKLRTREALVDAALASFSEDGLDAPSLDSICERAGCTRGAFYVHFEDRDDLIAAAMERRRNSVLSLFLNAAGGNISIFDVLDLFVAALENGRFPAPGAVRTAELVAACRRSKTVRRAQVRLMERTRRRLQEIIESDRQNGRLRAGVTAESMALLVLVLEAGAELLLDIGYPLDVKSSVRTVAQLMGRTERT